jgi:ferredoxin--NADP+ reductase
MGQLIDVTATNLGDVALFDLDRSLTGQDGRSFDRSPPKVDDPASQLASRLFETDDEIETVHVLSNTVSVARSGGWQATAIELASDVIGKLFVFYEIQSEEQRDQALSEENYNATITSIRAHNPDLWVTRIKPDEPIETFKPGQYTTLALGFWERRADEVQESFDEDPSQREKMARRSYSVSSSIVDEGGGLVAAHPEDVEFYIVQVRPGEVEFPSLTPRLFTKTAGDRVFMSHKFTGRYTLDGVNPTDNIVFLSTGTGEAPQNHMTAELLRNGHQGAILNIVCVRYRRDLAYMSEQESVQSRFPTYKYLAITTREPENEGDKVYIQDLVTAGRVEEELGAPLDPANTHVFLCGNPSMIGLPRWDDNAGTMEFPEVVGVCELLHERGFKIDHRKERGNVHYEEYWKDR